MTQPIRIESRVGSDGVLTLRVPLGAAEAGTRVRVTVEPLEQQDPAKLSGADWRAFVRDTYGSCSGLDLERQPQGEFEQREGLE